MGRSGRTAASRLVPNRVSGTIRHVFPDTDILRVDHAGVKLLSLGAVLTAALALPRRYHMQLSPRDASK